MIAAYTIAQVKAQPRPPVYLDEIRACATHFDDHILVIDTESECWRELVRKYDGYKPTVGDLARAAAGKVAQAASLVSAVVSAPRVSDEVAEARRAVCEACELKGTDPSGEPYCTICGCPVAGRIANLTLYEEDLPARGCKHPAGSRWAGMPAGNTARGGAPSVAGKP